MNDDMIIETDRSLAETVPNMTPNMIVMLHEMELIKEELLSTFRDHQQTLNRSIGGLDRRVSDIETFVRRATDQFRDHDAQFAINGGRLDKVDAMLTLLRDMNNRMQLGFSTIATLMHSLK